jgi:hypothetical protein
MHLLFNILDNVNDAKLVRIHECFRGCLSIVLPCFSEWELPKAWSASQTFLESNEHGIARVSHYTISFAICLLLTELQI